MPAIDPFYFIVVLGIIEIVLISMVHSKLGVLGDLKDVVKESTHVNKSLAENIEKHTEKLDRHKERIYDDNRKIKSKLGVD